MSTRREFAAILRDARAEERSRVEKESFIMNMMHTIKVFTQGHLM